MDRDRLTELLEAVRGGTCSIDEAFDRLRRLPYEDLGFAQIDHHRVLRNAMGEVVFGEGKTPEQIVTIAARLVEAGGDVLVTRCSDEVGARLCAAVPGFEHHALPRLAMRRVQTPAEPTDTIAVVSAGTADLPVAEEAACTAEFFGFRIDRSYDVGVAGLHRLLDRVERIRQARVVIVVAGMEGALPSVVGGLVDRPVVAVPTSVGYGASFSGLAALLGMLNSCAAGVVVVNVDNGFGAAAAACRMVRGGARE
jgi:NCAIR mutase (PurE)-related protein